MAATKKAASAKSEAKHGVDPVTGAEQDVDDARRNNQPVMEPESRGTMHDVTFPRHIQAPPVEQVASGVGSKRNQREAAAAKG